MANDDALPDPARVVIRRRIEWIDTDAAGIYHWTTVFRLAEAAEGALHTALGFADETFGACPRVAVSATFSRSLRFNDRVEVELAVEAIGRTSLTYRLAIASEGEPVAEGSLTVVFIDRTTRRGTPWPPLIRERLASAGLVEEPVL
jgi:acyl-CoA thioester hydrolase